jgi:serine protease Do
MSVDHENAKCKLQIANCKLRRVPILQFAFCILQFAFVFSARGQTQEPLALAAREEAALRAAAERVADSVVQIRTIGGLDAVGGAILPDGPTTGLVVSADGYIVSSAFNFAQEPASILVTFASGKQVPAELVATDHSRMIVLLKAAGVADLPVPEAAPENDIRVGQWAVAVGRTFRADRTNVSVGIVSAMNRIFGKVLQTDANVSMANYGGPLVDIQGRVLGVIVPIAPQGASEVAGVEWYDSGIGFAVPLEAINNRLEQLKRGEDLRAGILGIGLMPRNPHSAPAELAAVRPHAPAGKAGFKKGDRIVEVDGRPIRTQTDLRFALGTRYGGDRLEVTIQRGEEKIQRTLTLADTLPPFRHAFLGVLPLRPIVEPANGAAPDDDESAEEESAETSDKNESEDNVKKAASNDAEPRGVGVRMVYAGSPAETAGIKAGDRILEIGGVQIRSIDGAIAELNNFAPGSDVAVQLGRGDQTIDVSLRAGEMPRNVPNELPPADDAANGVGSRERVGDANDLNSGETSPDNAQANDSRPLSAAGETRDVKLPEFPQACKLYVPASHDAGQPQGLLLWLHDGDAAGAENVIDQWKPTCDRDGLLLAVPTAAEANRWDRTELEYLGRLAARLVNQHKVDSRRVVVFGQGSGGQIAWSLGFSGRSVLRGIAVSAAPLPRRMTVPANEPGQRLAIFAAISTGNDVSIPTSQGLQKCADAGYAVSTVTLANDSGELAEQERDELARWIDTLDRF